MVVNNTKVKMVLGQPGTGKSTRLIQDGVDKILQMKSVCIVTPTHTAKDNLIERINKMLKTELNTARIEALNQLKYNTTVLYGYAGQTVVLMDEISMISIPTLFNIFFRMLDVNNGEIIGYGDAKQLPVIQGNSVVEMALRNNLNIDVWEWVRNAYDNLQDNQMIAPKTWKLAEPIDIEVLRYNYRFQSNKYNGYSQEYIDDLISNTIHRNIDDYSEEIIEANKNNTLIITPSHSRGEKINDAINNYWQSESQVHMPFVIKNKKVYLNPKFHDYQSIKQAFPFVKELKGNINDYEYTGYIVTNVAQGATVDNVLYYMGNTPIHAQNKSFYNRNNFYTAVTRSRQSAQLIGPAESFNQMQENIPISAQERLQYVKSNEAVKILFDKLYVIKSELSLDSIHDLYLKIFNELNLSGIVAQEIHDYEVVDKPLNKQELILEFKLYDYQGAIEKGLNAINYREIIYDKYISDKNKKNAKKPRMSRVEKWIKSLNTKQLKDVQTDVMVLSQNEFKFKHNKDVRSVIKYL